MGALIRASWVQAVVAGQWRTQGTLSQRSITPNATFDDGGNTFTVLSLGLFVFLYRLQLSQKVVVNMTVNFVMLLFDVKLRHL